MTAPPRAARARAMARAAKCRPATPTRIVRPRSPGPFVRTQAISSSRSARRLPDEIVPPAEPLGWTRLRIKDSEGEVLADASEANQRIETNDIPDDGVVRIYAEFDGDETHAYIQLAERADASARTCRPAADLIPVEIVDGQLERSVRGARAAWRLLQLQLDERRAWRRRAQLPVEIGDAQGRPTRRLPRSSRGTQVPRRAKDLRPQRLEQRRRTPLLRKEAGRPARLAHRR